MGGFGLLTGCNNGGFCRRCKIITRAQLPAGFVAGVQEVIIKTYN